MSLGTTTRLAAAMMALGAAATAFAATAQAAPRKTPPSCAAISFRPVGGNMPDGEQQAGLYGSRFGRLQLMADIRNGQPQSYYLLVNGKRPEAFAGALPKAVEPCLQSKHIGVPVKKQGETCTGQRFRVVIDNTGKRKLVMLFGLQDNQWLMCSASQV